MLYFGAMKRITKTEALALYENNGSKLAKALDITRQAVSKWPEGPIPEIHDLRIRYVLMPSSFKKSA